MAYFQTGHWLLLMIGLLAAGIAAYIRRRGWGERNLSCRLVLTSGGGLAVFAAFLLAPWIEWLDASSYGPRSANDSIGAMGNYIPQSVDTPSDARLRLELPAAIGSFLEGSFGELPDHSEQFAAAIETLQMLPHPMVGERFQVPGWDLWRERLAAERLLAGSCESDPARLVALLQHEHAVVRAAAAQALAFLQHHDAIPTLLHQLPLESDYLAQCTMAESVLHLFQQDNAEVVSRTADRLPDGVPTRLLRACIDDGWNVKQVQLAAATGAMPKCDPTLWRRPEPGDAIPNFEITTALGGAFQLNAATTARPVLVSFITGDHCYMCDVYLQNILMPAAQRPFSPLVCLVLPSSPRRTWDYVQRVGLDGTDPPVIVLADYHGELAARFGLARQFSLHGEWCTPPAAFLIDAQQTLQWMHIGKSLMDRATVFPAPR